MRAQFEGEVLEGSAEQIPLPDHSVDAVFAGEAFHWFDLDRALDEIRRVGGGLAILARSWGETEQPGLLPRPFWAELDAISERFHPGTRVDFPDWRDTVHPDGPERFEETVRISGRDLVDLHLGSRISSSPPRTAAPVLSLQHENQRRLDGWLHGWLLVHIPLAVALMVVLVWHMIVLLKMW